MIIKTPREWKRIMFIKSIKIICELKSSVFILEFYPVKSYRVMHHIAFCEMKFT